MNKNKNGYAWYVSVVDYDGVVHSGIQYAWFGNPAIDFFVKNNGIKLKAGSAVKPSNLHPEIVAKLGLEAYL